ncbi:MAG: hypothetical protein JRH20_02635 [Deltaproteobacteria bacterium]|nr:hypothetical protein [Deltaproteobacteria bacterium]
MYRELTQMLAGKRCRVVNAPGVSDAIEQAREATAIIVNAAMGSGAGEDLCRRLRATPATAQTLLFVRGTSHQRVPNVDEVLSSDLQHTIAVLETYIPELSESDESPTNIDELSDEALFDITASAEQWQRNSATEDWPPKPPTQLPKQELIVFAKEYAGYAQSLNEGYDATDLPLAQRKRLQQMGQQVVLQMDTVLGGLQDAINDALKRGDLMHMRGLSAAKNIAFSRLQQLRTHVSAEGPLDEGAPEPAKAPPAHETTERETPASHSATPAAALNAAALGDADPELPTMSDTGSGLAAMSSTAKSRLTLAAEAKDAQRTQKPITAPRPPRVSKKPQEPTALTSPLFWLLMVVLAAGGAGIWTMLKGGGEETSRPASNQAPQMQQVSLREDPNGVLAHPKAIDHERDTITFTLLWSVDGTPLPAVQGTRLPSSHFSQGQKIVVKVTPRDAWGAGRAMLSQPLNATGGDASE